MELVLMRHETKVGHGWAGDEALQSGMGTASREGHDPGKTTGKVRATKQ